MSMTEEDATLMEEHRLARLRREKLRTEERSAFVAVEMVSHFTDDELREMAASEA